MVDVLGSIKSVVPAISTTAVTNVVMYGIITLVVILIAGSAFGLWAYTYMMKKKFNITIQLFELINGQYRPTRKCKAMELNYSDSGEKAIFIKELKRYRAKPTLQMGDKVYWLALDSEGSLVNIGMENVDFVLREMKVETTETESRANRIAFQKALGDRLKTQEGFWAKYGKSIMNVIYIVLVSIAIVFILAKVGNILSSISGVITQMQPLMDKQQQILTALDNIVGRLK